MKDIKNHQYSPKNDFNRLCQLIGKKDPLTFDRFIELFPKDKESQQTLINYIHRYENGLTANPTILEYLIDYRHVSTSPQEFIKIAHYLLALGSPVTTLVLQDPQCREWVSTHEVSNWSCTGCNKSAGALLYDLMSMKFPIATLEKIVELQSKSEVTGIGYITDKAFEYFSKDKAYAHELIDFLIKHQLVALSPAALQQDLTIGTMLIEKLGSQCLGNGFSGKNIEVLNYVLKEFKEPFKSTQLLLNAKPENINSKIFQLFHWENMQLKYCVNPLEIVISRYLDESLTLSATQEIITFLLQKGAFPSSNVLLALKKITNLEIQTMLLNNIMLNYVPTYLDTGKLRSGDQYYYPDFVCKLLETLIQFNPPIHWLSQIIDFINTCYWKQSFYQSPNNNLLESAFKMPQDNTYTLQLIEFLLKNNIPIHLKKLNESLDEIKDKEFRSQLCNLLLPNVFKLIHSNLNETDYKTIFKLLCYALDFEKIVGFIDILKKTYSDCSAIIYNFIGFYLKQTIESGNDGVIFLNRLNDHFKFDYRLVGLLKSVYRETQSSLLRNKVSELLGIYEDMLQPFQHSSSSIDILPRVIWLYQSNYYFTEVKSHLKQPLEFIIPSVVLSIIFKYAEPPSLMEAIIDNSEPDSKFLIKKLTVTIQDIQTSDCGTLAFINGLVSLAFLENTRENLEVAMSILGYSHHRSEEKQFQKSFSEMSLNLMTCEAMRKKQTDNDVSPITMRRMMHSSEFGKFFDKLYVIHQIYPSIVPVIKMNGSYQISCSFDISEQLNMLYKLVTLSDLYHRGKLICHPLYIFTENHWITLLMTSPEISDNSQKKKAGFLVCDSLKNTDIKLLTTVISPIQQAITNKENLQNICKQLLIRSYQEIECFSAPEVKLTSSLLRRVKLQLRVWLAIMKHDDLDILGGTDVTKFKIAVGLITIAQKSTETLTATKKHQELIAKLRKFSLFDIKETKLFDIPTLSCTRR